MNVVMSMLKGKEGGGEAAHTTSHPRLLLSHICICSNFYFSQLHLRCSKLLDVGLSNRLKRLYINVLCLYTHANIPTSPKLCITYISSLSHLPLFHVACLNHQGVSPAIFKMKANFSFIIKSSRLKLKQTCS